MPILDRFHLLATVPASPEREARKPAAFEALSAAARSLGCEVIVSSDMEAHPFGYDGDRIRIDSTRGTFDLAHELGHFQIAHPDRRGLVEFGLGEGFSTVGEVPEDQQPASDEERDFEELCACLLATCWLAHLGVDTQCENELVNLVDGAGGLLDWSDSHGQHLSVGDALETLIDLGLVDDTLTPLAAKRARSDLASRERPRHAA